MDLQASNVADPIQFEEIHAQLDRIIASASFRNSQRLSKFLQFLVDRWLTGSSHEMKERIVGAEVFGRPADYDVAVDPVVRVAAGDMRKRLAQYYMQEGRTDEIRFDLPRGSYILQISRAELTAKPVLELLEVHERNLDGSVPIETIQPIPESSVSAIRVIDQPLQTHSKVRIMRHWMRLAAVLAAAALSAFVYIAWTNGAARQLDTFWEPILSGSATLICVGDLNSFMQSGEDPDSMPLDRRMRIRDHVGPNDVLALARISGKLGSGHETFSVLLADNATFTDLRSQPAVLIGASDNRWTGKTLEGQRFQFRSNSPPQATEIIDTKHPEKHEWTVSLAIPLKDIHRDYAIVARIPNSVTGQTELVVAGIGPYGTAAASEFVTNPKYFQQFTSLVSDWHNKSIEIVLSTDVIDGRSGAPHVEMVDLH